LTAITPPLYAEPVIITPGFDSASFSRFEISHWLFDYGWPPAAADYASFFVSSNDYFRRFQPLRLRQMSCRRSRLCRRQDYFSRRHDAFHF
jgi:hypothetical protein